MLSRTGPAKIRNEADFQKMLRASLGMYFGERLFVMKTHGNQYTGSGVADLVGHVGGIFFAIECKVFSGRPSSDQYRWMKKQMSAGGIGFWCLYDRDNKDIYWESGDKGLSYRNKNTTWIKTSWIEKKYTNANNDKTKFYIMDCHPLVSAIILSRMKK